jgi:3'-5' exoribonuclease 1
VNLILVTLNKRFLSINRGHKDVLKKRLKSFYRRKYLARSAPKAAPKKASYDFYIVIDFEATCEQTTFKYLHEIIEFPAVLVNASDGTVVSSMHFILL